MTRPHPRQFVRRLALACIEAASAVHLAASAAPAPLAPPEQLSLTAATNLAAVAGALERQNNGVAAMVAERTDALVALQRLAATAQRDVDRELIVFANTRGTVLAGFFTVMTKTVDAAADAPAQLDAAEAAVRADAAAGTAVPAVATDKLQSAAKKLAVLAKQQSNTERLAEWVDFYKDTKAQTDALNKAAGAAQEKANDASGKAASVLLAPDTN